MIITCPECSSQFLVDRIEFGSGARKVRCSVCGHDWQQSVLNDQTPRRAPAQAANRFQDSPTEIGSDVAAAETPSFHAAGDVKTMSSSAANEAAPEPADLGSTSPDQEGAPKSDKTSQDMMAGGDLAAAAEDGIEAPVEATAETMAEAASINSDGVEDAIGFESESLDPEQDEKNDTLEDNEDHPVDPAHEPNDAENDTVSALKRASKARLRRWMIPAAAVAGVALIIGGLVLARDSVVRVFPTWASAYKTLGISSQPAIGAGLEFHQVTSRREWSGAEEVLIVRGKIANVTDELVSLPSVRVALYDGEDAEVQAVTVANALPTVSPGEKVSFEARIPGPAVSAQRIRVSFDVPVDVTLREAS